MDIQGRDENRDVARTIQKASSEKEFLDHLITMGLIKELPDKNGDKADDESPIRISGEPLSQAILNDRR